MKQTINYKGWIINVYSGHKQCRATASTGKGRGYVTFHGPSKTSVIEGAKLFINNYLSSVGQKSFKIDKFLK